MKLTITAIAAALILAGCKGGGASATTPDREMELAQNFGGISEIEVSGIIDIQRLDNPDMPVFSMDFSKTEKADAAQLMEITKVVPLETTEECLIGHADKIIYADSIWYILDIRSAKSLFAFDSEGRFITVIGAPGRAPGEYIEPTDFYYDSKAKEIVIWDQFSHRFSRFDRTGEYKSSSGHAVRFNSCAHLHGSGTVWCMTVGGIGNKNVDAIAGYSLLAFDSKFSELIMRADLDPQKFNYSSGFNMQEREESILFHPQFSDTIFGIYENGIKPEFALSFSEKNRLPATFKETCKGDYDRFIDKFYGRNYTYFEDDYKAVGKYLICRVNENSTRKLAICSGETGKVSLLPDAFYANDDESPQLPAAICTFFDDAAFVEGSTMTVAMESSVFLALHKTERQKYLSEDPAEDDNPILLTVTVK